MQIDPQDLDAEQCYKLITGIVVPRPIAWVTSVSANGGVNLAPFSAFTFVSPKPPMLGISIGRKGSDYKDTARNILEREEYVTHIADQSLIEALHLSSEEVAPHISEADMLNLNTVESDLVGAPRLSSAPIAMECRLRHCIEFGETRSRFLVGEVIKFHIKDGLMNEGKIQTTDLDPICRLGGPNYATLGKIVTLPSVRQTPKSTV